jgi:hypothetical protein
MAASNVGCMSLFVHSILWDLDIPQEAATIAYEDNDGCTAMGNAQKPTARTRHIDIKYFALCDWIERNLIHLERINTSINIANHLTKSLSRILLINIPISSSGTFPRNILQYTSKLLPHITTVLTKRLIVSCQCPLQPPQLLKLLGYLSPHTMTYEGICGCASYGMSSTIHHCIPDCGGVLVYT